MDKFLPGIEDLRHKGNSVSGFEDGFNDKKCRWFLGAESDPQLTARREWVPYFYNHLTHPHELARKLWNLDENAT